MEVVIHSQVFVPSPRSGDLILPCTDRRQWPSARRRNFSFTRAFETAQYEEEISLMNARSILRAKIIIISSQARRQSIRMEKGDPIRFVKGTYAGLVGWKNKGKSRKKGSYMIPVIVLLESDKSTKKERLKATKVKFSSYRKRFTEAANKEEAALQQHQDLEAAMINCAGKWAEIGTVDPNSIVKLFLTELGLAQKYQRQLNNKARYRCVEYPMKRPRSDSEDMSVDW